MKTAVFLAAACASGLAAQGFESPQRMMAGETAINVDIGHAAPFYFDFDGDGVRDLLVGEFGKRLEGHTEAGKLRVYRNVGTDKAPKFAEFEYFKAGGDVARVPTG